MIDYGIAKLLDRRGRTLLARCQKAAPGFRVGVEELRIGPCYVWRVKIAGREFAEAISIRRIGRPPSTVAFDLAVFLQGAIETIQEQT